MSASSPVLQALRDGTRVLHEDLERRVALGSPSAGRDEYARHVGALWGWIGPVDLALWGEPWAPGLDPARRSAKVAWLTEDVAAARRDGFLSESLPRISPADGPAVDGLARRFGVAYVIEGSMLGGQVLLRRLGETLAPWPLRYLRGYEADGPRLWREFLGALDASVREPAEIDAAVAAARSAFAGLGNWMRARGAAA